MTTLPPKHSLTQAFVFSTGRNVVAQAEDAGGDAMEGEEDEATVETDEGPAGGMEQEAAVTETVRIKFQSNISDGP